VTGTCGLIMIDAISLFTKHPLATSGVFTVIYAVILEMPTTEVWGQGERDSSMKEPIKLLLLARRRK